MKLYRYYFVILAQQGFLDAIRLGIPVEVPLEDGLKAVRIGVAAEESVQTHMPVRLG